MCPLSTALPPPVVEAVDSWAYPMRSTGEGVGTGLQYSSHANQRNQTIQGTVSWGSYGSSGGTGSSSILAGGGGAFQTGGGQEMCRVTTTVAAIGQGLKPPMQKESYGPASEWNPGASQPPGSVVSVYGVTWRNSDGVANWPDDTTGFCFCPNTSVMTDVLRPAAAPQSGFGLFFNDDGAGNAVVEYLSWLAAATVERVTLPAGIVTDLTELNSMRFILVSAASGREASVTIEVNGVTFLTRDFGSGGAPDIPLPAQGSATALHYVFANVALLGGGAFYDFIAYGYNGRFKPNGQELQAFGA